MKNTLFINNKIKFDCVFEVETFSSHFQKLRLLVIIFYTFILNKKYKLGKIFDNNMYLQLLALPLYYTPFLKKNKQWD